MSKKIGKILDHFLRPSLPKELLDSVGRKRLLVRNKVGTSLSVKKQNDSLIWWCNNTMAINLYVKVFKYIAIVQFLRSMQDLWVTTSKKRQFRDEINWVNLELRHLENILEQDIVAENIDTGQLLQTSSCGHQHHNCIEEKLSWRPLLKLLDLWLLLACYQE